MDPGERPGETTITFQYFAIPAVSNKAGSAHDGTTTLPSEPTEKFVFGRKVGRGLVPRDIATESRCLSPWRAAVGTPVTA